MWVIIFSVQVGLAGFEKKKKILGYLDFGSILLDFVLLSGAKSYILLKIGC